MTQTTTTLALLIVALQDLHDAERAWGERGAKVAAASGAALRALVERDLVTAGEQEKRLRAMLRGLDAKVDGDPNIWLRAILDDAERDISSIIAGPLRDTALVGALRKGKQAERVSYETAIALADALGREVEAQALRRSRDEEDAADSELHALLAPLTSSGAGEQD